MRILLKAGAMVAVFGVSSLQAGDWKLWRGDAGMTGVSTESLTLPLQLSWKQMLDKPIKATAVSDGRHFYLGDGKGKFVAMRAENGSFAWEYDAKFAIEGSAALVHDCVIFGSMEGSVIALEAATGKERWRFKTEGEIHAAPNIVEVNGRSLVLIGSYDNNLYALDAKTGEKVWVVETGNYVNGSAGIVDGKAAFGGCDGFLYFVQTADGREAGKYEAQNPIASTVAASGSLAILGHYGNELLAVDTKKMVPQWTYKDREFPFFSSPAVSGDGHVYAGDRGKRLHCLRLADGTEKWAFRAKGRVDSSPVIMGSHVVFGSDDGNIYILKTEDGTEAWKYEMGPPIQTSPCIAQGLLVMGADDGSIYAFKASP